MDAERRRSVAAPRLFDFVGYFSRSIEAALLAHFIRAYSLYVLAVEATSCMPLRQHLSRSSHFRYVGVLPTALEPSMPVRGVGKDEAFRVHSMQAEQLHRS